MTSFHILGPIEVWSDERRLIVGGTRQIALLAFLLLHANRAVSNDTLIDRLWKPARSATDNRLCMAVARLRKSLAPLNGSAEPVVRTVGGGYLLSIKPHQLDAELFAERVQRGVRVLEAHDPALATGMLSDALALWRGPPLAEVTFEDFAQPEIRRLQELRRLALDARIDADLQLGRHARLIGELEQLLAEDPLRERTTSQLMLALYRSQRQADALEAYQRTRVQLAEQLGLEPGPALKRLHAEILDHASTLKYSGGSTAPTRPTGDRPTKWSSDRASAPLWAGRPLAGPSTSADRRPERDAPHPAPAPSADPGRRTALLAHEPRIHNTSAPSRPAHLARQDKPRAPHTRNGAGLDLPYDTWKRSSTSSSTRPHPLGPRAP
jgi:DNA-binding SARP family transcriptional activator